MKYFFTLLAVLTLFTASAECTGERYKLEIFPEINVYDPILYGNNIDNKGQSTDLVMTVTEPKGDNTEELRPLIIFVHGGSFTGGDRNEQNRDLTAAKFTRMGYVTANIEYRLEQTNFISPFLNFADKHNWFKAMIRASQDLRASIRYFKKDVSENGNTYKIDTNKIILYGSSAGGITVLNTAFIDNLDEMTIPYRKNTLELGGLEGNSGNPGYTSLGVKAVVSCSGAFDNVGYLENNTDIALLLFHHTLDLTVPFDKGCFVTVACFLGQFFGSNRIAPKAKQLGMTYEFYPIDKEGHPADAYADTENYNMVNEKTTNFLYNNVICDDKTPTPITKVETKSFKIFPNPNLGVLNIENDAKILHQTCTLQVINLYGEIIHQQNFTANTTNQFQLNTIADGVYFVRVAAENDNQTQYMSRLVVVK